MRKPLFLTIALVCSLAVAADEKPVKGTFITNVDDHATIYVNGIKVFHADIGTSRSEETELKIGDRVVAHLT
ncbi:MAG: hypothetical protein NTY01_04190, partial [Verrucomicrobia bacterium]|nr:hypothetical protein [Verrucomicrobiota bacterium]